MSLIPPAAGGGSSNDSSSKSPFLTALKRFDMYRSIPAASLTEQTIAGASISVVAMFIMSLLFLTEFISLFTITVRHEMHVDHSLRPSTQQQTRGWFGRTITRTADDDLMTINLNITLPRMPCAITEVGVQDVIGSNIDFHSQVKKYRTDNSGAIKYVRIPGARNAMPLSGDYGGLAQEQKEEGCNLQGHIKVKKVPGNVHITSNAMPEILQMFLGMNGMRLPGLSASGRGIGGSLNTTHIIHSLWFGSSEDLEEIPKAAVSPLSGATKVTVADELTEGNEKSYEYFIRLVPTSYQKRNGRLITDLYQYTSNSNEVIGRYRMPSIYFRYDVEALSVKFIETSPSFMHFLVQCCAIIGGTFTVLGLINAGAKQTLKMLGASGFIKTASGAAAHSSETVPLRRSM